MSIYICNRLVYLYKVFISIYKNRGYYSSKLNIGLKSGGWGVRWRLAPAHLSRPRTEYDWTGIKNVIGTRVCMCACQLVFLFVYLPVCLQYWMNTPSLFPPICMQMLLLPCMSSLRVLFRRLPVTLSSFLYVSIYGSLFLSLSLMFCVAVYL